MDSQHETPSCFCRFLDETHFGELHNAFLRAFADYVMPFDLTEVQFRNHLVLNAVDLASSVGWFDDGKIVGFTLNGFGLWRGIQTVYDAGTGVLPEYRRQGLSVKMFDLMMPEFESRGYRQCLLEVITTNEKAIRLYDKLHFQTVRTLSLLHCENDLKFRGDDAAGVELREIDAPDWNLLSTFWDGEPSWQNSPDAIGRSRDKKRFVGAFAGYRCVGYIVFSKRVGRVSQIAVDNEYRRLGVGKMLVRSMIREMSSDYVPQVINIDRSITSAMSFFENRGFTEKLSQYEMLRVY